MGDDKACIGWHAVQIMTNISTATYVTWYCVSHQSCNFYTLTRNVSSKITMIFHMQGLKPYLGHMLNSTILCILKYIVLAAIGVH